MDAGLEHFDMGLVNYRQHPTNVNYMVYRFKDLERAQSFEDGLNAAGLWFERSDPEEDEKQVVMFAVEKKQYKKTQRINFKTEAKHKNFLISNRFFRVFFVALMLGIITLATLGYCQRMKVLQQHELESSENY